LAVTVRETEVLVIGLGAMGSAALYYLARQGVAPVGLDQYRIGHPFGSSHGNSRAIRIFYHDPLYVQLVKFALPLWKELESLSGEQLLMLNGSIIFAKKDNPRFNHNVSVIEAQKVPYRILTPAQVADCFPALHLPPSYVACHTTGSGFVNAGRSVQVHTVQAQRFGATVHPQVQVYHVDLSGEQPVVDTSSGRYRCQRLVITPGPWAANLLADLSLPLRVTRQQKFYFKPSDPSRYRPEHLPVFADYETLHYGFPFEGAGVKVADDNDGDITTIETINRSLDLALLNRLKKWLETIMPGINATFVDGATCMYTTTTDRDFLIGPHPKNPNVLVGAGFSGHGFKFAPLVGHILAQLAIQGQTDYPIEKFRLDRFN